MMSVALVLGLFFVPLALILLAQRFPLLDKLGLVFLAFAGGIGLASIADLGAWMGEPESILSIQTQITELSIALSIPLLVMSMNVKDALKTANKSLLSMCFAVFSVVLCATVLAFFLQDDIDYMWQVAGMSVGAYVGGGPNMAAISVAIEADQATFMKMTTYDIVLSAAYLIILMTVAKPLFSFLLASTKTNSSLTKVEQFEHLSDDSAHAYKAILKRERLLESVQAIMVSILIVGLSVLLSSLLSEGEGGSMTIIAITTLGLISSWIPWVQRLKNAFQIGMFLVLVFCFTMGTMTDLALLAQLDTALILYITGIMIGAVLLHALLCRYSKLDVDTFLIASAAAIMSVPFIPVVAGALRNKHLIAPGFAIAVLGYILGNYLGVFLAHSLKAMGIH